MLDRAGRHALAHAAQLHYRHLSRQEWIFGKVFEISAVQRMPVNIHAGSEQGIDAVLAQFQSLPVVEFLDQHIVPGAGKTGAGGHRKCLCPAVHADPAGSVGAAAERYAEAEQPVCYAAESRRCAGSDLGGTHALTSGEADQVFVGELREEIIHGHLAVSDVAEFPALVSGIGNLRRKSLCSSFKGRHGPQRDRLIGQFIRAFLSGCICFPRGSHSVKCKDRRHRLLELFDGGCTA